MHIANSIWQKTRHTAALLLLAPVLVSAQGIDASLSASLQTTINNLRTTYNVKGISAAAYIPGKGMWKGVTGVSHGTVPIDTTMLFCMGSITKTYVAAEVFKLIDAGLLSLTDTVGALLPPHPYVNPGITVAQLLGHKSGMGEYNSSWAPSMFADPTAMWYYTDALSTFCSPAAGPPGSPFQYCNTNYSLLGMIIEAKTGDSVHRAMRNDLLNANGYANTHMEVFESYANPIPHNWATPTLDPTLATDEWATPHQALWSSIEPQGGYFSDAADLARWGYDLYSGHILSAASMAQMLTFTPVTGSYFNGYGLGAMRFAYAGKTYIGHAGNYFGYAASMLYYPEDSICVAVLINQDCIATFEARALMHQLLLKLTTGVAETAWGNSIDIMPNPAHDALTISLPATAPGASITVCNMAGSRVYSGIAGAGIHTIGTAAFASGVYFIKVAGTGGAITRQVVIQH